MSLTKTTADAALKEDYQPVVREQLNQSNMLLAQIERNSKDTEGRRAVLSLHTSRSSGVGARAEGGTLPTAGNQGYTEERIDLRRNYGRIEVSGPAIREMKSDKGSFVREAEAEMKGITADLKRDVNRQLFGTSNGVVATCGTTSSSTTVTLLSTATNLTTMRQFNVGDIVDIGTVADPVAVAEARTITAVNRSAETIVISGATVSTTSGTHFVFRTGSGGAIGGAGQKELTGLQTIVAATGTVFNVAQSSVPVWASYVSSNSGTLRAPTDTLFETVLDEVSIESGEDPNLIITTAGVNRAFANGLKDQKRFSNTIDLKGGFKALSVNSGRGDVALTWDRDCPGNRAFVLNTAHLIQFESSDWEWMDEDGAVLNRVPNKDAYEATLFKYHELATDQRNAHGLISDLEEAS